MEGSNQGATKPSGTPASQRTSVGWRAVMPGNAQDLNSVKQRQTSAELFARVIWARISAAMASALEMS